MNIIDKKYKVFKNGTVKNLEKNEFVPQRIDKNGYIDISDQKMKSCSALTELKTGFSQ